MNQIGDTRASERPHDDVSALMTLLGDHWVMTLATIAPAENHGGSVPVHAAPVFYALSSLTRRPDGITNDARDPPALLFASDPTSLHGRQLGPGPTLAAAALYLETEDTREVRGVQLRGRVVREDRLEPALAQALRADYLARHPVAARVLAGGHQLFALCPRWAKLTDNRRGFGHHACWRFRDILAGGEDA